LDLYTTHSKLQRFYADTNVVCMLLNLPAYITTMEKVAEVITM